MKCMAVHLEGQQSHDEDRLWNAEQRQLITTGTVPAAAVHSNVNKLFSVVKVFQKVLFF